LSRSLARFKSSSIPGYSQGATALSIQKTLGFETAFGSSYPAVEGRPEAIRLAAALAVGW